MLVLNSFPRVENLLPNEPTPREPIVAKTLELAAQMPHEGRPSKTEQLQKFTK